MRVRTLVLPVLAVLALAASGCSAPAGAAVAAPLTTPSKAAPSSSPPAKPVTVPDSLKFTGTTLDGRPFDASTLAGKPVILWFWAPWCATCQGQGSTVNDIRKEYDGKVGVVGIAGLDKSAGAMNTFVKDAEVGDVTHLNDSAGKLWKRFGIKEQSVFVMIDRTGRIRATGYQDTVTLGDWASYLARH
jgi:thiol-disulfide isomerase/thioredoxin